MDVKWRYRIGEYWWWFKGHVYGRLACRLFGHGKHLVHDGYCSGDGAEEWVDCTRCGWTCHHIVF